MTDFSCSEAEPLLPLVADGALRAEDDPALFDHLAVCPRCQESLARHDLVSLALTRTAPAAAAPRIIRHRWWLALPVAAAAALAVSIAVPATPASVQAAPPAPAVAQTPPAAPPSPVIIERDVTALPTGVPGKRVILVRRGDQILVVDPAAAAVPEAPTDAVPASVRY